MKWPVETIDVVAQVNPKLAAADRPDLDEIVCFVPMAAVSEETQSIEAQAERPFSEVAKGYTPFKRGDVLVAKITPCFENGKMALADNLAHELGLGTTEFHVFRPSERITGSYLFNLLRAPHVRKAGAMRMKGAAGQRRVPADFFAALQIPLPPLAEQKRIAEILDKADALRGKRRAALAQLDTLTQSIFLDMFGDPATNPKGWPAEALRSLGRVTTGSTPSGAKEGMFDGAIPFITPGDLESDQPIKRTVTDAGAEASRTVDVGATLVCCIGATIGKIGKSTVRSAFNQQINAVEWGERMHAEYGCAVMRFFKPTIIAWGSSTTLPILKKSSFERIEIPVPPVTDQQEFALRIERVERVRATHRVALSTSNELFSALQVMAFRGDL